ncbi:ATPase [Tritrichomonas foetus]|uniref:ATPase n=1 Tax=Tritrichomonas foetus TaxID=1144522 RepID=A0A1J4JJJ2_9EUKA|nr:ATPase [Tritrichomonas foetus]|eukprot:OHS99320.1 ATPase [Tritrichomonas foetus]
MLIPWFFASVTAANLISVIGYPPITLLEELGAVNHSRSPNKVKNIVEIEKVGMSTEKVSPAKEKVDLENGKGKNFSGEKISIFLIQSTFFTGYPIGTIERCVIKQPLPQFYVFQKLSDQMKTEKYKNQNYENYDSKNQYNINVHGVKSDSSKIGNIDSRFVSENLKKTVFIEPSFAGSYEIYNSMIENGYDTTFTDKNSSFLILSEKNEIDGYSIINIENSPLSFARNLEVDFLVYSIDDSSNSNKKIDSEIIAQICKLPKQSKRKFLFTIGFIFMILVLIRRIQLQEHDFKPPETLYFWIFDSKFRRVNGIPIKNLDSVARKYLKQTLTQSQKSHLPSSSVIRLKRGEFTHQFQRAAAFPLPFGFYIAIIWDEKLPEPAEELAFNCKLISKDHSLVEQPKLSFSSFRDTCPVHLTFTMDNNVKFKADLPASILAPFQPYGQLVTVILSIFHDLVNLLTTNPFIHSNYEIFSKLCCQKISARRGFCFLNEKELILDYYDENLQPLTKDVIFTLPGKVKIDRGFVFIKDLITPGKRCFVDRVSSSSFELLTIIELESGTGNDFFEMFGLPFFNLCCIFMYQLSYTKEQNLRFERFMKVLTDVEPKYSFSEIVYPAMEKNIIPSTDPNDYTKYFAANPDKYTNLIKDSVLDGNPVIQSVVKFDVSSEERPHYLSFSANSSGSSSANVSNNSSIINQSGNTSSVLMNKQVMTMIVEDVTKIKEKEFEQIETLNDLKQIIETLDIITFQINEQKDDALLPDIKLFTQLHYSLDKNSKIYKTNITNSLSSNGKNIKILQDIKKNKIDFNLKQFVSDNDLELFDKILEGYKSTIRLVAADGSETWYYAASEGNEGYMFSVNEVIDIKCRLQTTDEGLQLAASTSSIVFWLVDPETDNVQSIFMQPTIWDSLSVDQDMKFYRFSDFVHDEDRDLFILNYSDIQSNKINQWIGELRLIKIGGSYEWHRVAISKKEDGYLQCFALNINKQKETENKHKETQKLRDLLLSSGKLSIWKFTDDFQPIEEMHSFEPGFQNSLNMNWTFIKKHVHSDYCSLLTEKLRRAFMKDDCIEMDLPLMFDEEIWVSLRGKSRSQSRQVVGVCIDITELRNAYNVLEKEKKRAEEANRKKTIFLANMSHEIRTPMNGIFGMLDVLALKELTSEQRLLNDSIRASSFQLMKLLDDTLNLTKIEQGNIEWNPQVFDISKLFEPICIAAASRARLNHLKLNVFVDKKFPRLIYGDSQLFSQILNNLLSNALKFTKEGGITIRLSWSDRQDSEFCILEVQDTGIGISADQQRVIFERFSQADASTARFFGGTGLGLSLVQDIVRFLGGTVSVESEANQGTKFIVEIPFESIYVPYSPPFNDGKNHVVLTSVVDKQLSDLLTDWISYHNYTVIHFETAEEITKNSEIYEIEAIFVEGNPQNWPNFSQARNALEKKQPPIVSMCEAGEPSYFKYTLAKPVQYFHLIKLLSGFRYGRQNISSSFIPVYNDEQKQRILVVEDNKANQFVMKKILETFGCTFKIAGHGREAIKMLDQEEFDIVFMDCQMPVLDGIEATRIIRRSGKLYASIPIIALTASAVEGDEQTCREAGMDGYLAKPVRIQQINDIMRQFSNH